MATRNPSFLDLDYSRYNFRDTVEYVYRTPKGLTRQIVAEISAIKGEPEWMRDFRLRSYEIFIRKPMPTWGADLSGVDFDEYTYYLRPTDRKGRSWDEVPEEIRRTFERLGIPEAERKFLAGVGAQYESEVVYHHIREDLAKKGVIFVDTDTAVREYPDLVRPYFGTVVPPEDNKFAALNSAVWSGGSFVYVPAGVRVDIPLQAYFRINAENVGQFERTLIIAEENSYVHYIEGCTAPIYSKDSLHSAVVEIIARRGAHVRYTTIQNWSKNVYNLVTKRAVAYEDATVEWVDGNMGCLTGDAMVYKNNDVVPIRDVQVGDFVWSLTPDFRLVRSRVVAKKVNPPRPVYRLVLANGRGVKATDNHPFLVLRRVGRVQVLRWLPLAEIRPGDGVAIVGTVPDAGRPYPLEFTPTVRGPKPLRFPEFTDERLMWLLGFYTGGGSTDRSRVDFGVAEDDPAAPKVQQVLKDLFGVEADRRGVTLGVDSVDLVEFLRQIGFAGTATTRRIPRWVFTLPHAQKRAFIEGYIAADGRGRKGHGRVSVPRANGELLEQVWHLAISCGMNPTQSSTDVRRDELPRGKEVKTYFLDFSKESLSDAPVYFARVVDIQPAGEEVTYDIEVEGTANFIANGVFAHNSKVTMKYPCVYLLGKGAKAEILSVAYAGAGQHQDSGGKVIHGAPYTTSTITSKSISKDGGRTTYRGLVKVPKGSVGVKVNVRCDALILDEKSRSDTYPYMEIEEERVTIAHEATVGKISDDQIFYLMSRGLTEAEALALIVLGFIESFAKVLPMEYAIELNRLIQLEMEGAVG